MTKMLPRTIGNRIAPLRFILFVVVFILVLAGCWLLGGRVGWARSVMAGFDLAATLFLVSLLPLFRDGESQSIRRHAAENDANRAMLLVVTTVLSAVLLVTVSAELVSAHPPMAMLVIVTLGLAWLFANTVYALHYAHLYYGARNGHPGLVFPDTDAPDYSDFLYFSYTLGMTFQTSDVTITGRHMRRIVLVQSLASFVFNIGILAFTINTLGNR